MENQKNAPIPLGVRCLGRESVSEFHAKDELGPTHVSVSEYDWTRSTDEVNAKSQVGESHESGYKREIYHHSQGVEVGEYDRKGKRAYTKLYVKEEAQHLLVEPQVAVQFADHLRRQLRSYKNVLAFPDLIDRIGQPASAPGIDLGHLAAAAGHQALEPVHGSRQALLIHIGPDDEHHFIRMHARGLPPFHGIAPDRMPGAESARQQSWRPQPG